MAANNINPASISHSAVVWLLLICVSLVSCDWLNEELYHKGEPKDGTPIYQFGYECYVNGRQMSLDYFISYVRPYTFGGWRATCCFPPTFTGGIYESSQETSVLKDVKYDELAFFLQLGGSGIFPLYDGNEHKGIALLFYIAGDGKGPFREGVDYASSDNLVLYYPNILEQDMWMHIIDMEDLKHPELLFEANAAYCNDRKALLKSLNGLDVKLLSSSFKFRYLTQTPYVYTSDILEFKFDFEEVITSVPEGCETAPHVGDTINVHGYYYQSLRGDGSDFLKDNIQKFVAPKNNQ